MRKFIFGAAAAALTALAPVPMAQAGLNNAIYTGQPVQLEPVQLYVWGGHNYCWYDGGWHGPGYYWCGYRYRRGFGWGGGFGWHGWHGGHRGGFGGGHDFHGGHAPAHHSSGHASHGGGHASHGGGHASHGGHHH